MYRSPLRPALLGCAHLPRCLPPRRLLPVDSRDSIGFIFNRSPALAGSCRIDPGADELTAMSTQHFLEAAKCAMPHGAGCVCGRRGHATTDRRSGGGNDQLRVEVACRYTLTRDSP